MACEACDCVCLTPRRWGDGPTVPVAVGQLLDASPGQPRPWLSRFEKWRVGSGGIIRVFTRYVFVYISRAMFSPHHRVRFSPGFSPVPFFFLPSCLDKVDMYGI